MAKQPTVEQLDQLEKDLRYTARESAFQAIRRSAEGMIPTVTKLRDQLRDYRRLTD